MPNFYVDISQDFVDRSGADSTTNVCTGPGGLLAIINGRGAVTTAAAAGDTVYIKGTGYTKQLASLTAGADKSATWFIGDSVQDNNTGSVWTGKIIYISGTTIHVQVNSGKTYADINIAHGINNTTRIPPDTTTLSGKAYLGITFNASGSLASGHIKFIGVEGTGWTNDGTRCVIDGDNMGTTNTLIGTGQDYIWLENIEVANADTIGIYLGTSNTDYWVFNNIYVHDADSHGLDSTGYVRYATFYRCRFSDNGVASGTGCGVQNANYNVFVACTFTGNATGGLTSYSSGGNTLFGCVAYGNGTHGFHIRSIGVAINCVSDDPSGSGSKGFTCPVLVGWCIGCRSTNANETGQIAFSGASAVPLICIQCVADQATDDFAYEIQLDCSTVTDTDQGYVDPGTPNFDYNLNATATNRSQAVTLP